MRFPLVSEYIDAIKYPDENLSILSSLTPLTDSNGDIIMSSGNFAVVFKMSDGENHYALKCFTREQADREYRYNAIDTELQDLHTPFLVKTKYLKRELFVDLGTSQDCEFPVVLMDWVEGETLESIIRSTKGHEDFYKLAFQFSKLAKWIISQPYAHGDIKPDNIIVRSDDSMVLIDYDGMYIPKFKGQKSPESGTPGYRHPLRSTSDYNESIDDFSLIVIELSLLLLAKEPSLFIGNFNNGIIFPEKDFSDIESAEIFRVLQYYSTFACKFSFY